MTDKQQKVNVLIVEDELYVGQMLERLLEELDYKVLGVAENGTQALELVAKRHPDVILMDIALPDISGIEVTRRIHETQPTPVVMLTAYDKPELLEQASAAGAGAYLVKPVDIGDIERAIYIARERFSDLMELQRLNAELRVEIKERERAEAALRESEQRFRTVADFTYDWEYWLSPDGQYLYISPSCERITGYSPGDFIADPELMQRIIHPDDADRIRTCLCGEMENQQAFRTDFRVVTRAGEVIWIGHICRSVYAEDGTWLGNRASNRDITLRKRAEDNLRESESKYRELVDFLPQPVLEFDKSGHFDFVNRDALRTFGYSREDFETLTIFQLLIPEDRVRLERDMHWVLGGRQAAGNSYTARRKDGNTFPIIMFSSLISRNGVPVGLRAVVTNTTWF